MGLGYLRTGQAAKELRISSHHARRLCEAGMIDAELTESGQWRIPLSEVERLQREGVPPIPQLLDSTNDRLPYPSRNKTGAGLLAAPSERAVDSAEEVVVAENELKRLRVERELEQERDWFRAREQEEAGLEAAEGTRRATAEMERRRKQWRGRWLALGMGLVPLRAPAETRLAVHGSLAKTLDTMDMDEPEGVVLKVVKATVDKSLESWRRQKETGRAIDEAARGLPAFARNYFKPTEWQVKAHKRAAAAIRELREEATYPEKLTVARGAVQEVSREYEHKELRESVLNSIYLPSGKPAEIDEAREAVRAALVSVPVGSPRTQLERIREATLSRFRDAVAKREETERREREEVRKASEEADRRDRAKWLAERHVRHVDEYLKELERQGELEVEDEEERHELTEDLREEIQPILAKKLVDNDMSPRQIRELVEDLVDRSI